MVESVENYLLIIKRSISSSCVGKNGRYVEASIILCATIVIYTPTPEKPWSGVKIWCFTFSNQDSFTFVEMASSGTMIEESGVLRENHWLLTRGIDKFSRTRNICPSMFCYFSWPKNLVVHNVWLCKQILVAVYRPVYLLNLLSFTCFNSVCTRRGNLANFSVLFPFETFFVIHNTENNRTYQYNVL